MAAGRWAAVACSVLLLGLVLAAFCGGASGSIVAQAQSAVQGNAGRRSSPEAAVPEKRQEVQNEDDQYLHSPMVVKLGAIVGMGPGAAATTFTVFNFAVLVLGVGVVVRKVLPKTLRDRSSAIQRGLVEARTATEEASARLSAVETRLTKLDEQIAAMRNESEALSARDEQRMRASVEEEKAKILAAADAEIASVTAEARRQLQRYAAELAIEGAARKLVVTAETDRLLVENFARQLGGSNGSKGGRN